MRTEEEKKAAKKAYKKVWYATHRDEIAAKNKAYYEANREEHLARCRAYYLANRDERLAQRKVYREARREEMRAYSRAYQKANLDKCNAKCAKRRAAKRNQTPESADPQVIRRFYTIAHFWSKTTGVEHVVDHIHPLVAGGPHHQDNLQIITATDNCRKNGKVGIAPTGFDIYDYRALERDYFGAY